MSHLDPVIAMDGQTHPGLNSHTLRKHLTPENEADVRAALKVISVEEIIRQAKYNPNFSDIDPRFLESRIRNIAASLNVVDDGRLDCVESDHGLCATWSPFSGSSFVVKIRTLCGLVVKPTSVRRGWPECLKCRSLLNEGSTPVEGPELR